MPVVGIAPIFGTEDEQEFANRQVQDCHATALKVWKTTPPLDFLPLQLGAGHARRAVYFAMLEELCILQRAVYFALWPVDCSASCERVV